MFVPTTFIWVCFIKVEKLICYDIDLHIYYTCTTKEKLKANEGMAKLITGVSLIYCLLVKNLPQTMEIVDMVIYQVVCQKFDFNGNSDFQNSQKLDHLQKHSKKFQI
jgi:hypothetical protein